MTKTDKLFVLARLGAPVGSCSGCRRLFHKDDLVSRMVLDGEFSLCFRGLSKTSATEKR